MTRAMQNNSTRTFTIADLNTDIDNEPRVHDICLAGALGFSRPRAIRQIIDRNIIELDTYGSLATRRGKSRGQSFTEYFLNEGQALLICMFAQTVAAAAVRKALINVFMEYRLGRIEKPIKVQAHTIKIDVSGARGNAEIMDMVSAGVQQGLTQFDREILPRRFKQIAQDPYAVG
ncbi:hypothetical protein OIV19_05350 [Brucella sp. HL-2]|nr:hypothetical protein [Brucella sp. HL-2]MCV9907046.1 hypothetical protein [Brucella sp. HL-2]